MLPGKKFVTGNQAPFISKEFSKVFMLRSKCRNIFLNEKAEESRQKYNKQRNLCAILSKESKRNYFNPVCHGVFLSGHARGVHSAPMRKSWWENAFGMKFGTVILCNVTNKQKILVEKIFQNCSYRYDGITKHVIFLEKLCEKWLKYVFF